MGSFEIFGLVLDRRDYRERDLLLSVLCPDRGSLRGIFRGARGGRAPRAAAAEPLSLVHAQCYQGPHAEMINFRQVEVGISSYPLASDFSRSSAAAVVAEALALFCPPDEPAPRRFRLGKAVLEGLLRKMEARTAIVYAQFWLFRLSGLMPDLKICSSCGGSLDRGLIFADFGEGCLCRSCAPDGVVLDQRSVELLRDYERRGPGPELSEATPALVSWMNSRIRIIADRPLKALDFFNRSC